MSLAVLINVDTLFASELKIEKLLMIVVWKKMYCLFYRYCSRFLWCGCSHGNNWSSLLLHPQEKVNPA